MITYRELSSIETDLGISAKTLYSLSNNLSKHYRAVELPKKNGGIRKLSIPDEALKAVQRRIAEKLLVLEPISHYATAYRVGTNVLTNALPHTGSDKILKLDIHKFFDNIRYSTVKDIAFPKERYAENIRILLSMLCYHQDALPQGAPTSPAISNIILYAFDNAVGTYCENQGITYTRYCDDMTFSGNLDDATELIDFVAAELKKRGFLLNRKKTYLISCASRQVVTGIVVNEKANVADTYKRQIRKEVYFLQKFGVQSHLDKIRCTQTPLAYLTSLLGKINFVLQVCPNDLHFQDYKRTITKLIKTIQKS